MNAHRMTNGAPLPKGMDTLAYQEIRLERCCACDMMAAKAMAARELTPAEFFRDEAGLWEWRCKCFCINYGTA